MFETPVKAQFFNSKDCIIRLLYIGYLDVEPLKLMVVLLGVCFCHEYAVLTGLLWKSERHTSFVQIEATIIAGIPKKKNSEILAKSTELNANEVVGFRQSEHLLSIF